jgi:hypothetical protein
MQSATLPVRRPIPTTQSRRLAVTSYVVLSLRGRHSGAPVIYFKAVQPFILVRLAPAFAHVLAGYTTDTTVPLIVETPRSAWGVAVMREGVVIDKAYHSVRGWCRAHRETTTTESRSVYPTPVGYQTHGLSGPHRRKLYVMYVDPSGSKVDRKCNTVEQAVRVNRGTT